MAHSSSSGANGTPATPRGNKPHTLSHKTLHIVSDLSAASVGGVRATRSSPAAVGGTTTPPRLPRTASSEEEAAAERRLMEQLRASGGSSGRPGSAGSALHTSTGSAKRRDSAGSSGKREPELLVKLLLLGDSGVGKTSLIQRYADHEFNSSTIMTAGVDYRMIHLKIDGRPVKLQIWDTAGQERFHVITRAYYKGSHGIILVYDTSDVATEDSFRNVRYWMETIRQHGGPSNIDKVLVGNKIDLPQPRLPPSRGKGLADEFGIKFFETSAKSGTNVKKVFMAITKDIVHRMVTGGDASASAGAGGAGAGAAAPIPEGKLHPKGKKGKKCSIM